MQEQGFNIPEDYFDKKKLELKAIAESSEQEARSFFPFQKLYPWLVAASLVLGYLLIQPFNDTDQEVSEFSELNEENVLDFLSEDPFAVYPESFLNTEPFADSAEDNFLDELDLESIESYLESNSNEYL